MKLEVTIETLVGLDWIFFFIIITIFRAIIPAVGVDVKYLQGFLDYKGFNVT